MKKLFTVSLALMLSLSAFSQTSGTGIGVILGSSIDFSAKFWTSETTAFDVAAGIDFGGWGGVHANADFLIHGWSFDVAQDIMKVYYGPGVGVGFYSGYADNLSISARAPGGVGWYFHQIPLECFAEVVPTLGLFGPWTSGVDFWIDYYIGARWYF